MTDIVERLRDPAERPSKALRNNAAKEIERLRRAIEGLLSDYRTEGCPDPQCRVCQRSRAAVEFARAALKAKDDAATP